MDSLRREVGRFVAETAAGLILFVAALLAAAFMIATLLMAWASFWKFWSLAWGD